MLVLSSGTSSGGATGTVLIGSGAATGGAGGAVTVSVGSGTVGAGGAASVLAGRSTESTHGALVLTSGEGMATPSSGSVVIRSANGRYRGRERDACVQLGHGERRELGRADARLRVGGRRARWSRVGDCR